MGRPDIRTDRGRRIRVTTREIGPNDADFSSILEPHSDIVVESVGSTSADTTTFAQHNGPFTTYERVVTRRADGAAHETTTWSVDIPWFWWMFTPLITRHFARHERRAKSTWWAPPQELSQREVLVLSLLAAASMASAFINTLFTQTVTYAAEAFNVGEQGQGVAVLLNCGESAEQLLAQFEGTARSAQAPERGRMDLRTYGVGAQILRECGVHKMQLMGNPRRMPSMTGYGLEITGHLARTAA